MSGATAAAKAGRKAWGRNGFQVNVRFTEAERVRMESAMVVWAAAEDIEWPSWSAFCKAGVLEWVASQIERGRECGMADA